jgi:hypothetical protein
VIPLGQRDTYNLKGIIATSKFTAHLYNKRACPTKNEPQQGISSLERDREGGERERGGKG